MWNSSYRHKRHSSGTLASSGESRALGTGLRDHNLTCRETLYDFANLNLAS